MPTELPAEAAEPQGKRSLVTRVVVLLMVVASAAVAWTQFRDVLTFEYLASREAELRLFRDANPVLVYGLAFLLYVSVTGLSLPGATILTLAFAWFFGFGRGVVLISFASTSGATLAFLLSRYILRDVVQNRFSERLAAFNERLKEDGAFYLFTLRLIPVVPFFMINVVMGLTPLRTRTFWWVSQIGMMPGTLVYVYAGANVPDFQTLAGQGARGILTPQLLMAFVLLAMFPFLARLIVRRIRPQTDTQSQ
jgi:uncharacterized membrane protein YdjX (TVP38/TMEM64 family)